MKLLYKLIFTMIIIISMLLTGCSNNNNNNNDVDDVDNTNQDNVKLEDSVGIIEDVNEGVTLSDDITEFSINSECRRDTHVLKYRYILRRSADVVLQIRSIDGTDFLDIVDFPGSSEKEDLIYFCDICPIEAKIKLGEEDEYYIRLKINIDGVESYSKAIEFSNIIGSDFMSKIACSSKEQSGCVDSEEPRAINTRGVITYGQEEYIENCIDQVTSDEYWCEDGKIQHEEVECENRCWLGRCA